MSGPNRRWRLANRPAGTPTINDFRLTHEAIPALQPGEVLVKTKYLSVDPYMRARMRNVRSYVRPLEIDEVMDGGVVGEVIDSKDARFKTGEFVTARLGWQDYAAANADELRKVDSDPALLSAWLGVLGMTGLTAYFALLDIGKPEPGETVVISGAAGAVGSVAGMIAKLKGCRVVGIAGSDEKVDFLKKDCGFDEALNYKTTPNIRTALKKACSDGLDIYFDNVGGAISDAAVTLMRMRARVIVCGQIALTNLERPEMGPRQWLYFLVNRARLEGFLVHDYIDRYDEGLRDLKAWLAQGKIIRRENIVTGLEYAPRAFLGLFSGENIGKQLVKC